MAAQAGQRVETPLVPHRVKLGGSTAFGVGLLRLALRTK
jgi:hypothetical protein